MNMNKKLITKIYIRFYLEIYYFRFSIRIILMISKFLRKPFNLKALDMHELHISKSSKKFMYISMLLLSRFIYHVLFIIGMYLNLRFTYVYC